MTSLSLILQRSALSRPVPGTLLIEHCGACGERALLAFRDNSWRCESCRRPDPVRR